MKKILTCVLALALLVALCACGAAVKTEPEAVEEIAVSEPTDETVPEETAAEEVAAVEEPEAEAEAAEIEENTESSGEASGKRGSRGSGEMSGGGMGGMTSNSGGGTTELGEGWESFTYTYTNAAGEDAELEYAVFVPDAYDGTAALPLVLYEGDATYVGSGVASFAAGECPSNWISDENMAENPCFFLVIGFTESATNLTEGSQGSQTVNVIDEVVARYGIDENRLYITGQSMGGILDFELNRMYPDKFAATVYVACQPGERIGDDQYNDNIANEDFASQTFVYIASALDPQAPKGQAAVMEVLDNAGVPYAFLTDMDYQDIASSNADAAAVLAEGYSQNFLQFATVTESGNSAGEHMGSFEYSYELNAIFEWLMQQSK